MLSKLRKLVVCVAGFSHICPTNNVLSCLFYYYYHYNYYYYYCSMSSAASPLLCVCSPVPSKPT